MNQRKALFIVNKHSGGDQSSLDAGMLELQSRGVRLIFKQPDSIEKAIKLIEIYRTMVSEVVIAGGDGTLSALIAPLIKYNLTLGILPQGTANDLARTLNIPESSEQAAKIIADGRRYLIDVGKVNGQYFLNAAHIGVGANVTHRMSHDIKWLWGAMSYTRSAIDALRLTRPFRVRITCDDQTFEKKSIHITVANGRFYGGGMAVHKNAAIDDQKMQVVSLEPQPYSRLFALAPSIRSGQLDGRDGVLVSSGTRIKVETSKSRRISADGEIKARTPAAFELVPKALSVYVPGDYVSPADSEEEKIL